MWHYFLQVLKNSYQGDEDMQDKNSVDASSEVTTKVLCEQCFLRE